MNEDSEHSQWIRARNHLVSVDPAFEGLFERFPNEAITSSGSAFQVLANAIVGQQISVTAAAAIFGRLTNLLGSWEPSSIQSVSDEQLRVAGLSARKVEYFRALAQAFLDGRADPERWNSEPDEVVLKELMELRGIGRWTAEMFLIFQLRRPDVLPLDDIGLLKGAAKFFEWEYPFPAGRLLERAEAWRPWRTVATWHLWRLLDPQPVSY